MKKLFLAFLIIGSLAFGTFDTFGQTRRTSRSNQKTVRIPALSKPIVNAPVAEKNFGEKNFGTIFERYTANYEVSADGTSIQTIEVLQRLTSDAAIVRFGKMNKLFNADLQNIEVAAAHILKADGRQITVAPDKIEVKRTPQAEAAPAFSSLKMVSIDFTGIVKGDAIFYKLRIAEKPVFDYHFSGGEIFAAFYEWKNIEINLIAPADYPIFVEAIDLDGGKQADVGDGKAHWQWRRRDFAAKQYEIGTLSATDFSPRLAVSSFRDYDELGAAYWANAKTSAAVTPEVQRLADKITANIIEPREQIAALYQWANKNVRYLSIVLGRGGWIPHTADETLANRYADCKDYTTLLQSLLAAKNIESHPFIVNADGSYWMPAVATPDFFNHAILYIPSLDLFADATAPNTRLGLIPQTLAGKSGFLGGAKSGRITIPANKPEQNQILSDAEITFAANGDVTSISKNAFVGSTEIPFRQMFADAKTRESEFFVRTLLSVYGVSGSGRLLKINDAHRTGERFSIEAEINLPDYVTFLPTGKLTVPVAAALSNPLLLEMLIVAEQRSTNLNVGATIIKQTYKLRFPVKVTINELPPALNFDNAAGSYHSEFKSGANKTVSEILLTREIIIKKDVVTPSEYPALRELIKKAVADYNAEIGYQADKNILREKGFVVRQQTAANAPPSRLGTLERLLAERTEPQLTASQANAFENNLKIAPDNIELRKRLYRFYVRQSRPQMNKLTGKAKIVKPLPAAAAAAKAARVRHQLWFVQNKPELGESELYGYESAFDKFDSPEYKLLRDEWLKQSAAHPRDAEVQLNAAEFLKCSEEKDLCENLLRENGHNFPQDYRFAQKLFELFEPDLSENKEIPGAVNVSSGDGKKSVKPLAEVLAMGEQALALIETERSRERDRERAELLPKLAKIAFKLENFAAAKRYATTLVLEFGDDVNNYNYDNAAHVGNIVLGRIALRENDSVKAKEYLLIAARAPQRVADSYLRPEMSLAEELFGRGEKAVTLEYLQLCEKFEAPSKPVLKRWQEEIKTGKTPSFNVGEL